jgi:hypothetical protein
MSSSSISDQVEALRSTVDRILGADDTSSVADGDVQKLMSTVVRLYAAKVDRDGGFPAVASGSITATDAMVATSALLRGVNLEIFELGLWQAFAGGRA